MTGKHSKMTCVEAVKRLNRCAFGKRYLSMRQICILEKFLEAHLPDPKDMGVVGSALSAMNAKADVPLSEKR